MSQLFPINELIKQYGKPKAILLDWDNTLADSWGIIFRALNNTFKEFGMEEWTFDDILSGRSNIHHSLRSSFPEIFGDRWKEAGDTYYRHFLKVHLDEIKLLIGAKETLEELKKLGIHLAIVSNKTGKYLRDELKHLGIEHYFDAIIGATDAAKDKPQSDPIILAMEKTGVHPDEYPEKVWMIGDSKTDIEAAINANCIPIIFGDADIKDYALKTKVCKIDNHDHFLKIVRSLV